MTLTNRFDTELARRLSDCSNWGLSSHQKSYRTFNMTVSCSFVLFSSGVADSRYFINEEDNKSKAMLAVSGELRRTARAKVKILLFLLSALKVNIMSAVPPGKEPWSSLNRRLCGPCSHAGRYINQFSSTYSIPSNPLQV